MSSFDRFRATLLGAALLGGAALLSGCSFSPVYGGNGSFGRGALADQPLLNFAYAKPNSRLEQVIYQELALRLGESTAQTAPLVQVSVGSIAGDVLLAVTPDPRKPVEVTIIASMTITARDGSGKAEVSITRRATASYTRVDQILADNAAASEAQERAAKAAAESLRLAVLANASR